MRRAGPIKFLWLAAFLLIIAGCTPAGQDSTPTPLPSGQQRARVVRVIDGDTVEIEGGAKVRYIGVDTPEMEDRRPAIKAMAQQAKKKNQELVEGKTVALEKDVSETDRYGRLLRYVYAGKVFVNAELVKEGYAYATPYPPDVKYRNYLRDLEQEARAAARGLWSSP